MIPQITELNFPAYATLTSAEVNFADMGERSITTQVKIDGQITPDFSRDWEVAFKGEKYIMPLRKPQGSKDNTSLDATINLTFHHWAEYQLKRLPFHTIQTTNTDTAIADKYQASVSLTLEDFCNKLFAQVLMHNYGESISIDLNPDYKNEEVKTVSINNTYIWNVLTELYKIYGVRWEIVPIKDNPDAIVAEKYVIKVGYPTAEIDHIFEYGFEGGLLKIERQVQSEEIRNMLVGRGGSENMPKYYFKQCPETESDLFYTDPDWVPELANIYFDKLRGATFRSYIQGWKHKHYNGANKRDAAYSTWAYDKGYNDEKFDPVEYVKDEESIKSYGELFGFIEDKEDIYPSINLSELNHAIAVEQITTDDLSKSAEGSVRMANVGDAKATAKVQPAETYTLTIEGAEFSVGEGKTANLMPNPIILRITDESGELLATNHSSTATSTYAELSEVTVKVYDIAGNEHAPVGLDKGTYSYKLIVDIHNLTTDTVLNVEVGTYNPKLMEGDATPEWLPTFQVWIPNLWGTQPDNESDEDYARRVWTKILGDRLGNEAKVMFTTGALATSEDYEFVITELPVYDTNMAHDGESSHWRLTLGKSDADYEATGLYVPSTMRQGAAGDKFVLLGIEPTQEYVEWAEKALDDAKTDDLNKTKDIQPTWSLTTDRVRLNNNGNAGALIDELQIGRTIRLADPRFVTMLNEQGVEVPSSAVSQYLQQIKYKFRQPTSEDAALNPDVELTLSNDYSVSANAVSTLQGDVEVLRQQIGSLSNLEKALRVIGDKLYLRKDGLKDRSYSPTEFNTLVSSTGFRNGIIGGQGWGFYQDANGSWVFETDKINVREDFQVNNLVVNQVMARGGMEIDCAAAIECTKVVHRGDLYYCYFDQKGGSVANLFRVDDVAYCHRWTAENSELKYYKRRVIEVGVDYIALKGEPQVAPRVLLPEPELTDFGYTGNGKPEVGDTIVHFGNYTDKTRQYVKVRDVINGGYERFLDGLDSVLAKGTEYYFVGVQRGMYGDKPRFYIGNNDNFIEFLNGKLTVKAELSVESTIGDKTLGKVIAGTSYLTEALAQNTTISGGLVLTSLVQVGASDGEVFTATAGMNGMMNSTHTNGGVVFWGGGTYQQAYDGTSTYVVYSDGTGHAAKGTIKFLENKLQVGQYVNLTNDGLDMTINGKRKMQMGNYETQPEFVMNHKKEIALLKADGKPLVSTSSLPLWRIASGTSYSAYVEGLGDPTNHKNFEVSIGSGIKGATLKFNLIININTSIPSSFTSLNSSGLPAVYAVVIDTKTGASYTLGTATPDNEDGRLIYSYSGVEKVLHSNHNELKLRVEIWNKIVLTDENKASGAWLQTETVNVNSGEFDTVEQLTPEYNQTTLGNNGLQVSWGNCHQYQKAGFWGVRVGELGLQVTDGNIKLRSRSMGGWVSLADYIKHVVSIMPKEGSEE